MEFFGYLASILIGITLGLIGGGGSILTIPILVYLFKITPESATSYSLFIVGVSALIGSYRHYILGNLKLKPALYFAIPSVFSLLFTRKIILTNIPAELFKIGEFQLSKDLLIMLLFSVLMITASISMIRKSATPPTIAEINFTRLSFIGLLIGFITGFLGAGGGFLIIPALLFFAKLSMKQAVGTSLLIIFVNSLIGFAGDFFNGIVINYRLLLTITSIAIGGIIIGTQISKRIEGHKLKPIFGWFVLVVGVYIILKEIILK